MLPIPWTLHVITLGADQKLMDDALDVLQGLLRSIPIFWGTSELTAVIKLHLEYHSPDNTKLASMGSLIKTAAKKVPAKTLVPTLCELWPTIGTYPRHVRIFNDSMSYYLYRPEARTMQCIFWCPQEEFAGSPSRCSAGKHPSTVQSFRWGFRYSSTVPYWCIGGEFPFEIERQVDFHFFIRSKSILYQPS